MELVINTSTLGIFFVKTFLFMVSTVFLAMFCIKLDAYNVLSFEFAWFMWVISSIAIFVYIMFYLDVIIK